MLYFFPSRGGTGGPDPFPGWMSWEVPKPGLVRLLLGFVCVYCREEYYIFCVFCCFWLSVPVHHQNDYYMYVSSENVKLHYCHYCCCCYCYHYHYCYCYYIVSACELIMYLFELCFPCKQLCVLFSEKGRIVPDLTISGPQPDLAGAGPGRSWPDLGELVFQITELYAW